MSIFNHMNDRKRIYVEELEKILDKIEQWEFRYEQDDTPGFRDPAGKREAREEIAKCKKEFEEKKAELIQAGKSIYR